jgi:succinate dehydrogenase / fumarate reductase iron-sulfur subunit
VAEETITLRIWRQPHAEPASGHFETFTVEGDPERDTVLDLIERTWSEHDRTIVFRHACHHASCGTCALRVDGQERLPCITTVRDVWDGHGPITLQPLRNAEVVADIAIDPRTDLRRISELPLPYVRTVEAAARAASGVIDDADVGTAERFEDCLECLASVSACPVASGDPEYLGPAVLAAADRAVEEPRSQNALRILDLVDTDHGVWECRSVWACSAVCPSAVDPAGRIMDLRRRLWSRQLRGGRAPA